MYYPNKKKVFCVSKVRINDNNRLNDPYNELSLYDYIDFLANNEEIVNNNLLGDSDVDLDTNLFSRRNSNINEPYELESEIEIN